MRSEKPTDVRERKSGAAAVAKTLGTIAPETQRSKGTKAQGAKKVRHVCYLPPDLSRWVKEEAFRRSEPGAIFAETDLFEEAVRLLKAQGDSEP